MMQPASTIHETHAADAFSRQSSIFDELYGFNPIINYKRERVRNHVLQYLPARAHILELNAGTGEDAIFFAQQGHQVHATDIAEGMQQVLKEKVAFHQLSSNISTEICSFHALDQLQQQGPYDHIFSNFAGLNCSPQLDQVLASLPALLKPGGTITLVIMPRFCLWEVLLALKGDFKTAFRRFRGRNGSPAQVEGVPFYCWYYLPSYVRKHLKQECIHLCTETLCALVPPSYLENFPFRFRHLYRWLQQAENKAKTLRPLTVMGDYYIISLRKK